MDPIKDDAIGGFNSFLADQQKVPGDATLTMMLFDDQFMMVHEGLPLAEVPPLNATTFVPRGGTALNDAIGRTINEAEARIGKMDEADRPGKVLVMILTDGMENQSKEFDKGRIQKIIKDHEAKGWEFMYLKAGPDAFDEASAIGIGARNYANVSASAKGMQGAYGGVSNLVSAYRAGGQSAVQCMSLQENVDSVTPPEGNSADNLTWANRSSADEQDDDGEV
jgi:hypothetical protein